MVSIVRKDFAKTEQVLSKMDSGENSFLNYDNGVFWLNANRGNKEHAERKYFEILENMLHTPVFILGAHYLFNDRPEQLIELNNKTIQILTLYKEHFSNFHWRQLSYLRESNAIAYFKLGDREKAANELKEHANAMAHMDSSVPFKNAIKQLSQNPNMFAVHHNAENEKAYEFIKNTYENL
jgi:hypothetical protein